ncbi:hypothetical protein [Acinetobacter bereziniae]|uniref:hypothetical protein n=1 Tax=Acinetobacter bereziniae TaxID=106648 RepID=UPI00124FA694|nr:hypothetical protein [Acinetobacter bereziniae]
MKLKLVIYLVCFISVAIIGCAVQKKETNLTVDKEIDVKRLIHDYFSKYPVNFKETTFKPEAYNKVFFIKKTLIENDLEGILMDLEKNGWSLSDQADGYYYFCYGTNYSLGVVNPKNKKVFKNDGSEIKFFDYNSVNFTFSYLKYGIYSCLNNI